MKRKSLFAALTVALLLSGCGGSPASEKSAELSAQYDYYQKSAALIEKNMGISADEADGVFLVMVDCGVSSEINFVNKNTDGTFAVWSAGDNYTVSMVDGSVSAVYSGKDQLYPESVKHNDLMDYELTVKDVMNGTGDAVIGQYAYIRITADQLEEMTADNLKEFADSVVDGSGYNWVSIMTSSGVGICFSGSDVSSAMYGELDADGSILNASGVWTRDADGNYSFAEN